MNERIKNNMKKKSKFTILLFLIFAILSSTSIFILQNKMLDNAQIMGQEVAKSFAVAENANIYAYELLLKNASQLLESQMESETNISEIQKWMENYSAYIKDNLNSKAVDMYASINGKIVAANYWEGDDTFDPTKTEWYKGALEANGKLSYTDAYMDAVTGDYVITLSQKIPNSDCVLAIDLYPQYFKSWATMESLPENSSFFLCDTSGTLIYYETISGIEIENVQEYVDNLNVSLEKGEFDDPKSFIYDQQGQKRGVYYNIAENGWTTIITIPYEYLLNDLSDIIFLYASIFIIFIIITFLMYIRESKLNKQVELTNETVRVLGNSYYAIYRINFQTEKYTMLKSSDYMRSKLNVTGNYEDFLKSLGEVIEKNAYQDFIKSFSIESIQNLVKRKVRDYGGDFLRLFNGEYKWVNVRLLFDESLDLDEAILCFREVDEEKQKQLQHIKLLEESLEAIQHNTDQKNLFFSNMSHDMRTPLNAIIGMSELAENHLSDPEKTGDYLRKINTSSKHLLELINNILEVSKFEQGKMKIESKPFFIKESVDECVDIFKIQAARENKIFKTHYNIKNNSVSGDLFRIQQILNNLLSNAFKFTHENDTISISVTQLDSEDFSKYKIVVEDTGVGMSKDFLKKIFIPFERETRFGAKNINGTGLGMPIVYNIVLQMGGSIYVESDLGKGSKFTVVLPLDIKTHTENKIIKQDKNENTNFDLSGKNILIAEDNELNMEIASEVLEMKGINITKAWNGKEAFEIFKHSEEGTFDAILMDMQMPEMNGCEATTAIRALNREDAKNIPIIAVTANAFTEDIAATTKAGMNAHISKPIDFDTLEKTLNRYLNR